jgi:KipI family sensor histidine kinase inhibitor
VVTPLLRCRAVGVDGLLVEVVDADQALDLALWARGRIDSVDIVPAARTVLFDGCVPERVTAALRAWLPGAEAPQGPLVELAVDYDGSDLASTASLLGITGEELVEQHTAIEHVVAFCGFAPGFGYLTGSPWDVPRLDSPRSRVEPGSVGLAGTWTGAYPSASPGGWRLIGRTDAVLWDPRRREPALLAPGTRVRFVAR